MSAVVVLSGHEAGGLGTPQRVGVQPHSSAAPQAPSTPTIASAARALRSTDPRMPDPEWTGTGRTTLSGQSRAVLGGRTCPFSYRPLADERRQQLSARRPGADLGPWQPRQVRFGPDDDLVHAWQQLGGTPSSPAVEWLRALLDRRGPLTSAEIGAAYRADCIELARSCVDVVRQDIRATTGTEPAITVDQLDGAVRISVDRGFSTPSTTGHPWEESQVLVEVASYLQSEIRRAWPTCPAHGWGLHPTISADGRAVWWCRPEGHAVSAIGSLR